ncbi:unnamed protein product [Pedinophyceae sp. YPF-701]|nr:unnamed protein product [Pedinophyceae sp. YPF-701]
MWRRQARVWAAAILCALGLLAAIGAAFKADEFKTCAQAHFCKRNRGKFGIDHFVVQPSTVSVSGNVVTGKVFNKKDNVQLPLTIEAYDGIFRIRVDEAQRHGVTPRFQVPEVLVNDFLSRPATLTTKSKTADGVEASVAGSSPALTLSVRFAPFSVVMARDGAPALTFNARAGFSFEHRREKRPDDEDGMWEESFRSHRDSKPRGPESIAFDMTYHDVAGLYGIPEHAADFKLKPTARLDAQSEGGVSFLSEPFRLYNLDVFEHLTYSPFSLYGSIPMLTGHSASRGTSGVFWLNSAEMFVDVADPPEPPGGATGEPGDSATQWIAESGVLDLFLYAGPTPADVARQHAAVSGTSSMPQQFALGYHQCRWNYRDEPDVAAVDAGFDDHVIPYDVLWLDIEHSNGKRYMTWDAATFPTPDRMQRDLASRGRKMVAIVDPHMKSDPSYRLYQEAKDRGLLVKNAGGSDYDGWCWPGASAYLDLLNPAVRDWWADQFDLERWQGSTESLYVWNDMNEPSVFNGPEITMQKDNLHFGGVEHRDVHNIYGLLYHAATAEGLRRRGAKERGPDGDRPFVLSRAFFAGTQRAGPIWTGDNMAKWEHLQISIPMLLSASVAGLPFVGADVGGFFGNPEPDLLVRWYQTAIFYPFFRGHAHIETRRREPWLFGDAVTTLVRDAVRTRYRLMPYLYTTFREANVTGAPVMRPLWYEFPTDPKAAAGDYTERTFMVGGALLAAPVVRPDHELPNQAVTAYLPPGGAPWRALETGEAAAGPLETITVSKKSIPAYLRGGSVLAARERPRRSTAQMAHDPVTLVVSLGADGAAQGKLYMDDGSSFAFLRGEYVDLEVRATTAGKRITVAATRVGGNAGYAAGGVVVDRVVVLGAEGGEWGVETKGAGDGAPDVERGPVWVGRGSDAPATAVVVRRAGLPVSGGWEVTLTSA